MTDNLLVPAARVVPSGSLNTAIVQFCRQLREYGLDVSPACTLLALEAAATIDIDDRQLFRRALGLSLIKRPQDRAPFYWLFDEYWCFEQDEPIDGDSDEESAPVDPEDSAEEQITEEVVDKILADFSYESFWSEGHEDGTSDEEKAVAPEPDSAGYDDLDPVMQAQELKRLVRAIQSHFSLRKGRRLKPSKRGPKFDLRRSMRKSVRFGGLPLELVRLRRKPQRPRMVLFVDVSRSMASYAKLLLQFASSVLRHAWQVEVFLFASSVTRVTNAQLNDDEVDFNQIIAECGGGTRIGDNLMKSLDDYPQLLAGSRNIVLILSDGLDSGEDEQLEIAMQRLSPHARHLVWLNPMLGIQDFADATREMTLALPYIDLLAPAHDAASLWDLVETLKAGESKGSDSIDSSTDELI